MIEVLIQNNYMASDPFPIGHSSNLNQAFRFTNPGNLKNNSIEMSLINRIFEKQSKGSYYSKMIRLAIIEVIRFRKSLSNIFVFH